MQVLIPPSFPLWTPPMEQKGNAHAWFWMFSDWPSL